VIDSYRPLSGDDPQLAAVKNKYQLPDKFILYLGTIEPRKNLVGLIAGYISETPDTMKVGHRLFDKNISDGFVFYRIPHCNEFLEPFFYSWVGNVHQELLVRRSPTTA